MSKLFFILPHAFAYMLVTQCPEGMICLSPVIYMVGIMWLTVCSFHVTPLLNELTSKILAKKQPMVQKKRVQLFCPTWSLATIPPANVFEARGPWGTQVRTPKVSGILSSSLALTKATVATPELGPL